MDIAKCTDDGVFYNAEDFSRLFPEDLDRKRRFLQCPECGGPAFFRHASPIGRAPCFGARPHDDGCRLTAYDYQRTQYGTADNHDSPLIRGSKIVVDFGYGSPTSPESVDGFGFASKSVRATQNLGDGYRTDTLTHRRPSSLLRTLIESPEFSNSEQIIEVHGNEGIVARDFFVPLLSVTPQHLNQFRGFWGLLSDVRLSQDKSTIWFNSGGLDTISFCLSSKYMDDFNKRYRIHDAEDLAGAYILVFGMLHISPQRKLHCVIEDKNLMALRLT